MSKQYLGKLSLFNLYLISKTCFQKVLYASSDKAGSSLEFEIAFLANLFEFILTFWKYNARLVLPNGKMFHRILAKGEHVIMNI